MGYLVGAMVNPLVWGLVLAVMYFLRARPLSVQFAVSLFAVLAVGLLFYSIDDYLPDADKKRGIILGLLSAALWFGIFAGVRHLRRSS